MFEIYIFVKLGYTASRLLKAYLFVYFWLLILRSPLHQCSLHFSSSQRASKCLSYRFGHYYLQAPTRPLTYPHTLCVTDDQESAGMKFTILYQFYWSPVHLHEFLSCLLSSVHHSEELKPVENLHTVVSVLQSVNTLIFQNHLMYLENIPEYYHWSPDPQL